MTATLTAPPTRNETDVWWIGAPRLLAGLDLVPVLDHATHVSVHGALPAPDRAALLTLLDASGLSGRGGAGFSVAAKIRGLRGRAREVVVNGTEGEPGSRKDTALLQRAPHLVLDGALVVAAATGATRVTVAVHDAANAAAVRAAIRQRPDAQRVRVEHLPGGFVAGEARAVLRALRGGPALPPGRRVHGTEQGVLVHNAETLAQLAVLVRLGPRRFADTGTRAEPGTTLLTVGGAVDRPGVVEVPLGTPLQIVLSAAGARQPEYVVLGGYHGSWHRADQALLLSREAAAAAGGRFGAGVVLVLDAGTCPLGELAQVTRWLAGESAKQCGPCLFGLPALANDIDALRHGHPHAPAVAERHAAAVDGRGACAHPDGTARFVTSALHVLGGEIAHHVQYGGCGRPTLHRLPVSGGAR